MRYVELWLDHAAVGCGFRRFVDMTTPRMKQAVLFYPPTLTTVRLDLREVAKAKEISLNKTEKRALASRIRKSVLERKRLGLSAPLAQAKNAISQIRESA